MKLLSSSLQIVFFLIITFAITLSSCSSDPCDDVICLNDGYCANGECVCPEGFTGSDCSQQQTPTRMQITKIIVTEFPATDNGAGWDLTSGCDIYPILFLDETTIWNSEEFFQNADPTQTYEFSTGPNVYFDNPDAQYTLGLYDYDDFDQDDFMGGINFTPYSNKNGFPEILNIDAGQGVAFKIHVDYFF